MSDAVDLDGFTFAGQPGSEEQADMANRDRADTVVSGTANVYPSQYTNSHIDVQQPINHEPPPFYGQDIPQHQQQSFSYDAGFAQQQLMPHPSLFRDFQNPEALYQQQQLAGFNNSFDCKFIFPLTTLPFASKMTVMWSCATSHVSLARGKLIYSYPGRTSLSGVTWPCGKCFVFTSPKHLSYFLHQPMPRHTLAIQARPSTASLMLPTGPWIFIDNGSCTLEPAGEINMFRGAWPYRMVLDLLHGKVSIDYRGLAHCQL